MGAMGYQHVPELHLGQPGIAGTNAGAADEIACRHGLGRQEPRRESRVRDSPSPLPAVPHTAAPLEQTSAARLLTRPSTVGGERHRERSRSPDGLLSWQLHR